MGLSTEIKALMALLNTDFRLKKSALERFDILISCPFSFLYRLLYSLYWTSPSHFQVVLAAMS